MKKQIQRLTIKHFDITKLESIAEYLEDLEEIKQRIELIKSRNWV